MPYILCFLVCDCFPFFPLIDWFPCNIMKDVFWLHTTLPKVNVPKLNRWDALASNISVAKVVKFLWICFKVCFNVLWKWSIYQVEEKHSYHPHGVLPCSKVNWCVINRSSDCGINSAAECLQSIIVPILILLIRISHSKMLLILHWYCILFAFKLSKVRENICLMASSISRLQ